MMHMHDSIQALILVGCAGAAGEGTGLTGLHGHQQHELPADLLDGLTQLDQPQLLGMVV